MIQTEPRGRVLIIRLDRADKRNALTPKMLATLVSHLDTAASARALVLSGVGSVFCAGFDLSLCRDDSSALRDLLTGLSRAVRAMRSAHCPVILSAHGAAVAGGCALAIAADIVITTPDARLGYPVVRLGISPAVNAPLVRAAIGDGPTRARLLDSALITGERALSIGLAHELAPDPAACEDRAIRIAEELAEKPPHALAFTKRWLNELDGTDNPRAFDTALEVSLSLHGGVEERDRLEQLWAARN